MKNITLSVSDDTYRSARVWAAGHGVSISKAVAFILEHLPTHPGANRRFASNQKPANPAAVKPEPKSAAPTPHTSSKKVCETVKL